MLTLPPSVLDALEDGRIAVRYLLRFDLDAGAEGLWNGDVGIVLGGVTYTAMAGNLTIDALPGHTDLSADSVAVTLSGLDPAVAAVIDGGLWHQRPVVIFRALLDDTGVPFDTHTVFAGFLDEVRIQDAAGATAAILLSIESNNRELQRSSGRRRSDSDQRHHGGASDGFYKYVNAVATNTEIYWGRKGPTSPV